jgi:prolyl-tRNA synthetase
VQVVIIPVYNTADQLTQLNNIAAQIKTDLENAGISVKYDNSDTNKPGWKFAEYELKGVSVRLVLGPRDLENGTIEVARRDTLEKFSIKNENTGKQIEKLLEDIQQNIYNKALTYRENNTRNASTWTEFTDIIENKGGFISAFWDGTVETENKIKEETKATIRCIPINYGIENGKCVYSGKPSVNKAIFARAY